MKVRPILSFLTLALSVFALKLVIDAGAFKTITPHFKGSCSAIPGVVGAEDLEYSNLSHAVFISSDSRPEHSEETTDGAIYAMDTTEPTPHLQKLITRADLGFEFHPHGLNVRDTSTGTRLWVINHRKDEDTIEVFDFLDHHLKPRRTLRSPLLINSNDIYAVGDERFYVTQDHGSRSPFLNRLEDYSRLGRGYITYFDGENFSVQAQGITYPNGIAATKDGSKLLIASMLGRSIRIYLRDVKSGAIKYDSEIALESAPDNLTWGEQGEIWVGAHPKLFALKALSQNHTLPAPAQILRVRDPLGAAPEVEEVFLDDGKQISAASVALNLGRRLLLGSIYGDHLLDCQLGAN